MKLYHLLLGGSIFLLASCGGEKSKSTSSESSTPAATEESSAPAAEANADLSNKGIGPVTSVTLGELDQAMADAGKTTYEAYCVACHKVDEAFIGPAPKGILERRSPEWVMNMILNPQEMTAKDPIAKRLLEEANGVPMIGQGLTEQQAREVLEYFRTL